ncbi:MAG: response regulator [Hyphomicrobiaceae bacterium]|nr:response regulator [Hyphomicrobiaceae bacterium]MCC0024948.1 response regulator [Hyphomicrobiaceae bacterium]
MSNSALILYVEDNPDNREILGRRLERRGFRCRFAVDAVTGVQAAADLDPDLIIMDIGLGAIDGCEATRRIKANPQTANIPVLALTASAFETDRQNALEAGCSDFDTKPVDFPRLLEKINLQLTLAQAS